ncbi:hypothetical protein E2C01_042060 [Portunus trituberculatus]|uniref:Uncharacterized protein n=1 Tax=Portunus trituberculatus TaxID=210409 RepID=A0A5B7FP68_PORTR|nr:hypothetical protein [Portunus trituberculatus]
MNAALTDEIAVKCRDEILNICHALAQPRSALSRMYSSGGERSSPPRVPVAVVVLVAGSGSRHKGAIYSGSSCLQRCITFQKDRIGRRRGPDGTRRSRY